MSKTAMFIFSEMVSIIAIIGAIVLAYYEKEGWGWCIFAAIACQTSVTFHKPTDSAEGRK